MGDHPQWSQQYTKMLYDNTPLLNSTDTTAMDAFLEGFQSEREIAITAAWADVDQSEMLAYASIGELPETIRWVADCFRRLIKVLALFRARKVKLALKRQFLKPVQMADALASFWLEMRYAVRPLMFEMEQLIASIQAETRPKRFTARGFHEVFDVSETSHEENIVHSKEYVTDTCVTSRSSSYRAGVLYEIGINEGNWIEVFGLDKPLESIYELTKLSFVLDWFLNVGNLLGSWTVSSNLTPRGSWLTENHTITKVITGSGSRQNRANHTVTGEATDYGITKETHILKRRTISPDKPVYPHIDINLNVAKLVDLAAIARSIYRGIR
jgi:hypothetical protein